MSTQCLVPVCVEVRTLLFIRPTKLTVRIAAIPDVAFTTARVADGGIADRFSWFTASPVLPRDGAQRSFHVLVRQNARSCQEWGAPYCRGPSDVRLPELLEGRYWLPLRRYTVARLRVTARCSAVLIRTHRRRIDPCQSFHGCLAGSRQNPLPIRSNLVLVRQAVEVYYTASRNYDQWPAYC